MDFLTLFFWVASILSLIGAYLVGEHNKIGFILWIISNPILAFAAYTTNSSYGIFMFLAFWVFAVRGYVKKTKPLLVIEDVDTCKELNINPDKYMTKEEFMNWIAEYKKF